MPSIQTTTQPWIVLSDLDGTLLDAQDYSFSAAVPALTFLAERQIPIVLCTSKTAEEVTEISKDMHLQHPFIVENGSALFIPQNYFAELPNNLHHENPYLIQVLGKSYTEILSFFKTIKKKFSVSARGFHEMCLTEIGQHTGLDLKHSRFARNRGYSEPFILTKTQSLNPKIFDYVQKEGYRILKGNRFYHLLGNTDKGNAVRAIRILFEQNRAQSYQLIGIGDSPNDLEMLQEVDWPVLVKKPNHYYADIDPIQNLLHTQGIGPVGWQEAIFKILKSEQFK